MRRQSCRRGFTLIEILIVISIIAVLASMILAGVNIARKKAAIAVATTNIQNLKAAVAQYYQDTGKYPGTSVRNGDNGFPALYEALCGPKPPKGKGGPNSPYIEFKEADILVWDRDMDDYRKADSDQIYDPRTEKYVADPWGNPYIYHENKSRARQVYMHNANAFDIYSTGPNGKDQTVDGERDQADQDDIGTW